MMPLSPPLPLVLLLVSDQHVPHSHSKLDFPVFYLQNSPEFVSPSQMLPRTNVEKKLLQSSLTQSCFRGLEYGFSKSLDFFPSACTIVSYSTPHPTTQQHTRPEGDTELLLALPDLTIPASQSSRPQLSHIYIILDPGRGRLLLIHTTLAGSFCWC